MNRDRYGRGGNLNINDGYRRDYRYEKDDYRYHRDRYNSHNDDRYNRDRYSRDRYEHDRHERGHRERSRHERDRYERRDRSRERGDIKIEENDNVNGDRASIMQQLEKENRTVFVRGLPLNSTDEELTKFFSQIGEIVTLKQVYDQTTKRPRGFGYVEYQTIEAATRALEMNGKFFKDITISATPIESKVIRIRNLVNGLDRDDLFKIFGIVGKIEELTLENDGNFKTALCEYENVKMAKKAIELYDGRKFGDLKWEVFSVKGDATNEIDEEDEKVLSRRTKEMLLMRVQGGNNLFGQENKDGRKALMLQNMFVKSKEKEGFEEELRADVIEELQQYCRVVDVVVDSIHPKGLVFVLCESIVDAQKAFSVLHLRWFNSHLIRAEYFPEQKFPVVKRD
ncbi:Protein HRB1 [Entamoeba marina]